MEVVECKKVCGGCVVDPLGKPRNAQGSSPKEARPRWQEKESSFLALRAQERQRTVSLLACVLEQLFSNKDDKLPDDPAKITMFHTETPPPISISTYFHRVAKYSDCSSECLVLALMHINRILHTRPTMQVNSLNIHRLLLTSVLCSAKFFDDQYFNNAYYARIGGVTVKELNCLEVEFLALINFDLYVRDDSFEHFFAQLSNPLLHSDCHCAFSPYAPAVTPVAFPLDVSAYWSAVAETAPVEVPSSKGVASVGSTEEETSSTSSTSSRDSSPVTTNNCGDLVPSTKSKLSPLLPENCTESTESTASTAETSCTNSVQSHELSSYNPVVYVC